MNKKDKNILFKSSYHTLFILNNDESVLLDNYLSLYNQVKHTVLNLLVNNNKFSYPINGNQLVKDYKNNPKNYSFAQFNKELTSIQKKELLIEFGMTARQLNSIKFELAGNIASYIELRETHFQELSQDIKSIDKQINNYYTNNIKIKEYISKLLNIKPINSRQLNNILLSVKKECFDLINQTHKDKQKSSIINQLNLSSYINEIIKLSGINSNDKNSIKLTSLLKSYCYNSNKIKSLKKKLSYKTTKYNKILLEKLHNTVSICFGSKKLFRQQFLIDSDKKKNYNEHQIPFTTHDDWQKAWSLSRNKNLMMVGAKAETSGNQNCIARINQSDGKLLFNFDIRLPDSVIAKHSDKNLLLFQNKYLQLKNIDFNKFNPLLYNILTTKTEINELAEPITYTISKNIKQPVKGKTFYTLTFTVNAKKTRQGIINIGKQLGTIGIDLNANHVAVSEINRHGNLVKIFNLYFNSQLNHENNSLSYDFTNKPTQHSFHISQLNHNQLDNMMGNLIKELTNYALTVNKPIVIEDLDFSAKKKLLAQTDNPQYARMLSSFIYGKFRDGLDRQCFKQDIELIKVNPSYTSTIGMINYTKKKALSVHQAASFIIARRGLFSIQDKVFYDKPIKHRKVKNNKTANSNKEVELKYKFIYRGIVGDMTLPVKPAKVEGNKHADKKMKANTWYRLHQTLNQTKKIINQEIKKQLYFKKFNNSLEEIAHVDSVEDLF